MIDFLNLNNKMVNKKNIKVDYGFKVKRLKKKV